MQIFCWQRIFKDFPVVFEGFSDDVLSIVDGFLFQFSRI